LEDKQLRVQIKLLIKSYSQNNFIIETFI